MAVINEEFLPLNEKNILIAKKMLKERFRDIHMSAIERLQVCYAAGGEYVNIGYYAFHSVGARLAYYSWYMVDYSYFKEDSL